jgi:tetratricopeptide (TPR) repeat protein
LSTKKKDFFISFNKSDQEWAEWISWQLEDNGYSVTYQNWDWGPGHDFVLKMQQAATECERTLIILSPNYLSASYTQPEWSQAFGKDPTGDKRLLIPVRVKKCELDGFFSNRVYIDFLEPPPNDKTSSQDHLLKKLLDGIKIDRTKPDNEPPFPGELSHEDDVESPHNKSLDKSSVDHDGSSYIKCKFFGKQRKHILQDLTDNWLKSGPAVSILQGFPGIGKSQLAAELASNYSKCIALVEPPLEAENTANDLLTDLALSLDKEGISDLLHEMDKGKRGDPYNTLYHVILRNHLLIIIDDFQRVFESNSTYPPKQWEILVEKLNNSRLPHGRLLLISNRLVKNSIWNENSNSIVLNGLTDKEAQEYFRDLLISKGLISKVPDERLGEISHRLGGNPRAIKTLVSGLIFDSLDNLLSLSPDLFSTGDIIMNHLLVEDFEREIINRTLSRVESDLLRFMRFASVYRRPFDKLALAEYKSDQIEPNSLRRQLIERFLMISSPFGDELHPLAREVSVARLSEDASDWKIAHDLAANYYLNRFKVSQKIGAKNIASSYVELRHHLYESKRTSDLKNVSDRIIKFALSFIDKPAQSKVPESTETIEERIALISAISDTERPKGLEFHLALCLKHRNLPDDYQAALVHARKAVGPRAYYASWLLLIELEYALNGIDAMLKTHNDALKYLESESNVFSLYHRCAQILRADDKTDIAIDLLEKGISSQGITCKSSLISLCAKYMEESGKVQDAIDLIKIKLGDENLSEPAILYKRCANLMKNNNQVNEAITLLRSAIDKPGMTKVYSMYLMCSEMLFSIGEKDEAIIVLKDGLNNSDVRDPIEIYKKCSEMLVNIGQPEEAITLMEAGISNRSIKEPNLIHIYFAELMEKIGKAEYGLSLLKRALVSSKKPDSFMYLSYAKILFHLRRLEEASDILKDGISRSGMKDKSQLIQMCSDLLCRQDRVSEGIEMLAQGIEDPSINNKFILYHAYSNLLEKNGRMKEAIDILKEGIKAPSVENKSILVQACAKLLDRDGKSSEAVVLIKTFLDKPGVTGLAPLYQICAKIMDKSGYRKDAIKLLKDAIKGPRIGNLVSLYQVCADLMLKEGQMSNAKELVTEGLESYPKDQKLMRLHKNCV